MRRVRQLLPTALLSQSLRGGAWCGAKGAPLVASPGVSVEPQQSYVSHVGGCGRPSCIQGLKQEACCLLSTCVRSVRASLAPYYYLVHRGRVDGGVNTSDTAGALLQITMP